MAILANLGYPVGNVRSATVMEISTRTQLENATVLLESALTVCTRQLVFIVTIVRKVTLGMPSTEHVEGVYVIRTVVMHQQLVFATQFLVNVPASSTWLVFNVINVRQVIGTLPVEKGANHVNVTRKDHLKRNAISWMDSVDAELALEAETVQNVKIIFGEIQNHLAVKLASAILLVQNTVSVTERLENANAAKV